MVTQQPSPDHLLTPAEVAVLVFVDPKTVSRWARAGKIPATRTPGGHRRFRTSDVQALMDQDRSHGPAPDASSGPADDDGRTRGDDAALSTRPSAADALAAEAVALVLEARAEAAAEAVLETAASVRAAAETAAATAVQARRARAFAAATAAEVFAARRHQVSR